VWPPTTEMFGATEFQVREGGKHSALPGAFVKELLARLFDNIYGHRPMTWSVYRVEEQSRTR